MPTKRGFRQLIEDDPTAAREQAMAVLRKHGMRRDLAYRELGATCASTFGIWMILLRINLKKLDAIAEKEGWYFTRIRRGGVKGRSGRPKGSSDSYARERRTKKQLKKEVQHA